jgi:hypothetical protein
MNFIAKTVVYMPSGAMKVNITTLLKIANVKHQLTLILVIVVVDAQGK